MALRCYWELPADEALEFDPAPTEVQGAGRAVLEFRGEDYHQFVLDHTDVSIYGDLDEAAVAAVAEGLAAVEWDASFADQYPAPTSAAELRDLVGMFQAYAATGATMRASV